MRETSLHFLWKNRAVPERYSAAVSIHSHTHHSKENLRFLHTFKLPLPLIPAALRLAGWHHRWATGRDLSVARVLWTPPLSPEEAAGVEAGQIRKLGLEPLVSLTDHDDIESGLDLRRNHAPPMPVSLEWTVPFDGAPFFHVGVHNLPEAQCRAMAAKLFDYTAHPDRARLAELFEMLHQREDVLVVLNHPMWDEVDVGAAAHRAVACQLLSQYGKSAAIGMCGAET